MSVYPSECWPAETTVLGVDGTIDAATGLPFIVKGTGPTSSPSYEIQYNRRQMRENSILAACRQGMVVDEGNLRIGVYPVEYTLLGARKSFAGATGIVLPANVSRVAYLDGSANVQIASAWSADLTGVLPLAEVTTSTSAVSIVDRRVWTTLRVPAARRYVMGYGGQVGSNQNAVKVFEFEPAGAVVLEQVQVFCTAVVSSCAVDVRQSGASVLAAPAAPLSGTVVKPAIATSALAGAAGVSVHVTTNGSGSVSGLQVVLAVRGE